MVGGERNKMIFSIERNMKRDISAPWYTKNYIMYMFN